MDKTSQKETEIAFIRKLGDGTHEAKLILDHLSRFCFEEYTTIGEHTLVNEGRRQVILEIRRLLKKGL